jgi:hypothetical protein
VRRKHQRLLSTVGAVSFAGLAVVLALRGGALPTVMAVLAVAVAIGHAYAAITTPRPPRHTDAGRGRATPS